MNDQKYHALYSPSLRLRIQPPIVTAPKADASGGWSQSNMIYPPGLESLMGLDDLFIKQKIDLFHVFTGRGNKYVITDNKGDLVYYLVEESETVMRSLTPNHRCCEFYLYDQNEQKVLRMSQLFRYAGCFAYEQELKVYSGSTLLGSVTEEKNHLRTQFYVRDASGEPVLVIRRPLFSINVNFKVMDEKHRVGTIQTKSCGFREMFSKIVYINFPRDLDAKIKAVLLGGAVLIDLTYLE